MFTIVLCSSCAAPCLRGRIIIGHAVAVQARSYTPHSSHCLQFYSPTVAQLAVSASHVCAVPTLRWRPRTRKSRGRERARTRKIAGSPELLTRRMHADMRYRRAVVLPHKCARDCIRGFLSPCRIHAVLNANNEVHHCGRHVTQCADAGAHVDARWRIWLQSPEHPFGQSQWHHPQHTLS